MTGPKELATIVAGLELKVERHPKCLRFEKLPGVYLVIYHDGKFCSVRHTTGGKIWALNRLLAAIEKAPG